MKILYVSDGRFIKHDNVYYGNGHYAYELQWKRYLEYFDEIKVAGRITECSEASEVEFVSVSSGPRVQFIKCPNLLSLKGLFRVRQTMKVLQREAEDCDAIVVKMLGTLGTLATFVARKKKIPYLVEVASYSKAAFWYYGTLTGKLIALPSHMLEHYIVKRAPFVVYVSRYFLQKKYPNRHYNVGCPDCCVPMTDEDILQKRITRIDNYNENTVYRLGFVGAANVKYKGLEIAIKALSIIAKTHNNFKLCVIGSGDYSGWMEMARQYHVEDMIEFEGIIDGGQAVFEWFDDIDIFVMPSFQETLGRALVEAMSRGCPALGSRETAIPEQLGNDCIFSMKDYKKLAELIINMCDNKEYMKLCAKENFYRAQKYSEEMLRPKRQKYWNDFIEYIAKRR
ncbi:MAG: glycosyltransferase family 4 protein [Lachnospiraceae bacterium]|nr:glycosyltransferase family 4 protein [Lachnospiraceae bacterium]